MVSEQTIKFPDPAAYDQIAVYDLLHAAAQGHAAIDLRLIESITRRGEQAVPDLLRFGFEDHTDDRVDLEEDLIAMLRHLRTPEAVPYFIECVRTVPEDVPDDLVEGLLQFSEQSLDPLIALYNELDEQQSSDVAFLLAGLGIRDERILNVLLERLRFDASDGAFCLGLYGDPAAIPALRSIAEEVKDSDPDLQRQIEAAIGDIETAPTETDTNMAPVDLNEMYPDSASVPVEVLRTSEILDMLESDSPELRGNAAEGLRSREQDRKLREALLQHAKSDPDAKVRARCWEALTESNDEEIYSAMRAIVNDPSRPAVERGGALVGL